MSPIPATTSFASSILRESFTPLRAITRLDTAGTMARPPQPRWETQMEWRWIAAAISNIADSNNYIRKVDTAGIITTVAGIGFSGNTGDGGPGTSAAIGFPQALLASGNVLYIGTTSSVWVLDLATDFIHLYAGTA